MDDDAIRVLVARLARPHRSGGQVIERAAIMAEGADSAEVVAWILSHAGQPEQAVVTSARRGLHGDRLTDSAGAQHASNRFVLPAGVL